MRIWYRSPEHYFAIFGLEPTCFWFWLQQCNFATSPLKCISTVWTLGNEFLCRYISWLDNIQVRFCQACMFTLERERMREMVCAQHKICETFLQTSAKFLQDFYDFLLTFANFCQHVWHCLACFWLYRHCFCKQIDTPFCSNLFKSS